MPFASELDAVTIDAFGTLVQLEDPSQPLRLALAEHGVNRSRDEVAAAFRAEARYYRPRSLQGRDATSLAALRRRCVAVFLEHLGTPLDPEQFVPSFMSAVGFRLSDGAGEALGVLSSAGLSLACVANWDISLGEHLDRLGVTHRFDAILSSAEAGCEKPSAGIFELALQMLSVPASRALHVGDEEVDRDGARAAGLTFEPAPLSTLPERLGL